jgi:hypothetical protein
MNSCWTEALSAILLDGTEVPGYLVNFCSAVSIYMLRGAPMWHGSSVAIRADGRWGWPGPYGGRTVLLPSYVIPLEVESTHPKRLHTKICDGTVWRVG